MEFKIFSPKVKLLLSSLCVAVVLFLAILNGINTGQQIAQAESIIKTANNLNTGFQYFYQDQNRFPSAVEFSDAPTMFNYFTSFPPQNIPLSNCAQDFVYKRISDANFQLNFCLPTATNGYQQGWNVINGSPAS